MPDPTDPSTPTGEVYKAFESPRQYYATVADSIPPAQMARAPPEAPDRSHDFAALTRTMSPRDRRGSRGSRSSVLSKTMSHPEYDSSNMGLQNLHISASEPKVFPGLVHENTRRNSLRPSGSGSVHEGSVSDRMSSSQQMEPAMGKIRYSESEGMRTVENSD